jgi:hypothetical protein
MIPLTFEFSLDASETVRAATELQKRARTFDSMRIVAAALVVSSISAVAFRLGPKVIAANVGVLVLMILFELGWPRYLERHVRKFYLTTPALAGVQRYVFADDGLTMSSEGSSILVRWPSILQAVETKEFFLFYYSPKAAYYLPRRVVGRDNQEGALRAGLREKLGAKASQLGGAV